LALAVDDNSMLIKANHSDGSRTSFSQVFLDGNDTLLYTDLEAMGTDRTGTLRHLWHGITVHTRVSESTWIQLVQQNLENFNVPHTQRMALPMNQMCLLDQSNCPTEADWCLLDPVCSELPFQRPGAFFNGTDIFVALSVVLVLFAVLFVSLRKRVLNIPAKGYRAGFAARVGTSIQLHQSKKSLTPEELAEEFKRIDRQNPDGRISQDDLWGFLSTGKAGVLDRADFRSLFAALDNENSGYVDFLEFCTFLGRCHGEYDQVVEQGKIKSDGSLRRLGFHIASRHIAGPRLLFSITEELSGQQTSYLQRHQSAPIWSGPMSGTTESPHEDDFF